MNPFGIWSGMHSAEKDAVKDIVRANPADGIVLVEAMQEAQDWSWRLANTFLQGLPEDVAKARYEASFRNGPADAARHCYWSALLASKLSYNAAMRVVFAHEFGAMESGRADLKPEVRMDLHNDRIGLDIGHRNKGVGNPILRDLTLKALHAGHLRQIDPRSKALVPTKSLVPST